MGVPTDHCGFTYTGETGHAHCCYRGTWRETGRCVWHAEVEDDETKPDDALRAARAPDDVRDRNGTTGPTELLDCAVLAGQTLPDGLDLGGAALRDADLANADLPEADLRNVDLRDATLRDADLRGADLAGANCWDADLHQAHLAGADLAEATLRDADCTDATLREADLTGVDFEGAYLNRADLFDADLGDAKLYGAIFGTARVNEGTHLDDRCVYDPLRADAVTVRADGPDAYTKAASTYQELENVCAENALLSAQSNYFVRRQDIHTREHRGEGRRGRWLRARVSRAVVLYGESPFRVLGAAGAVILLSTVLYPFGLLRDSSTGELVTYPPPSEPVSLARTLLDSFYFSTLSFTTMTYGHFVPVGAGKFLTMLETASGVVLIALLVFVFGRRATR